MNLTPAKAEPSCPTGEAHREQRGRSEGAPSINREILEGESIVLRPWYPVLGPCNVRFMTRATAILREIKVNYQSSFGGITEEEISYESAITDFCDRIKDEFSSLVGKSREEILATVLIDKSGEEKQTSVATSSSEYAPSFEIASGELPLVAFFASSDSPSIQDHVIYYRREYEMTRRRGLVSSGFHQFGSYLAFCEKCLVQVTSGILHWKKLEEMNMIVTLGQKWRELKCLEPAFPMLSGPSSSTIQPKVALQTDSGNNAKAATLNQAFLSACERGDIRSAERFFCQGASLYSMDANNESALEKAVKRNDLALLRFLVSHGTMNLNKVNHNGDTLVHLAAFHGHIEVLLWLQDNHGPHVDTPNSDGEPPLHHACKGGQIATLEWLFDKSNDPFATDNDGTTAMHVGAEYGHVPIVEWLALHGYDMQARNSMKCTPLDYAVWSGQFDVSTWIEAFEKNNNEWLPTMNWED